jgi:hypothetical protein
MALGGRNAGASASCFDAALHPFAVPWVFSACLGKGVHRVGPSCGSIMWWRFWRVGLISTAVAPRLQSNCWARQARALPHGRPDGSPIMAFEIETPFLAARTGGCGLRAELVAAEITSTIRQIASEVPLGEEEGLPKACVANCDNLRMIARLSLTSAPENLPPSVGSKLSERLEPHWDGGS